MVQTCGEAVPSHLELRRRTWYAVLDVPREVRLVIGKKRLVLSLKTDSLKAAERRVGTVVSQWKMEIEAARRMDPVNADAEWLRKSLAEARAADAASTDDDADLAGLTIEAIHKQADAIRMTKGEGVSRRFLRHATAGDDLIEPLWTRWVAESSYTDKTLLSVEQAKTLLLSRHPTAREVGRREAAVFVSEVLTPGRKPASVNKLLSHRSSFWRWLRKRGVVDTENPWRDQRAAEGARKGAPDEGRRLPMPEREGAALIAAVDDKAADHPADPDVLRLVAITGMRLEEACGLTAHDLEERGKVLFAHVREGKTAAAARRVPVVVPAVAAMLRRRAKGGGPLFPELTPDLRGDRSPRISQRLGRALRTITKERAIVAAHSWRHRAATLMEAGGVMPWTIAALLGHERIGESLGRYSKGPSDVQLAGAAACIVLPSA